LGLPLYVKNDIKFSTIKKILVGLACERFFEVFKKIFWYLIMLGLLYSLSEIRRIEPKFKSIEDAWIFNHTKEFGEKLENYFKIPLDLGTVIAFSVVVILIISANSSLEDKEIEFANKVRRAKFCNTYLYDDKSRYYFYIL
jgi:hypothetical protein